MPTSAQKAEYMQKTLQPILQRLVVSTLRERPESPEAFMLEWVRTHKPTASSAAPAASAAEPELTAQPGPEAAAAETPEVKAAVRNTMLLEQGLTPDLPGIDADAVTEEWLVAIDNRIDFVDHKTLKRMVQNIDDKAVHGHSADAEVDTSETHRLSVHDDKATEGSGIARQVLINCKVLSEAIISEQDIMHDAWVLPDGKDILATMFDGPDELLSKVSSIGDEIVPLLEADASLNKVGAPVKIFGDIHGHLRDVLLFFHYFGWPSSKSPNFVFNGDWVDRGAHQLEVLMLVYALKICYPKKIFLNRGNHEDIMINRHMKESGFMGSCHRPFGKADGDVLFEKLAKSFEYLPLGSLIENKILVVHGGIGDGQWELSYLDGVVRPIDSRHLQRDLVVYNCLWSDPVDEDQRRSFGVHDSPRDGHSGMVHQFGVDVTEQFCAKNKLGMIIRSHEAAVEGDGYEVMHNGKCMRVFSARDYEDEENDGSILSVEKVAVAKSLYVRAQMLQSVVKKHKKGHD